MKLFDVYPLYDVDIVRGQGYHVWDAAGEQYLDLYGGHAHPHYVEAISRQVARLGFYSNSVINTLQRTLAEHLGHISGMEDYTFFMCNSGAEANENAIKLASFATGRDRVVAFSRSFHGRTSEAVAVTDNPKIVAPVNDVQKRTFVPLNDIEAVRKELAQGDVCAVIVEGIQGVGGMGVPTDEFLQALQRECHAAGTKLILDEVQSGCGRTGKYFAFQHAGISPDIISVAKGIGNGFPVAGILIAPDIEARYGMLGTTFGGNHLACAACLAVIDVMQDEHLMDNAARIGAYAARRFAEAVSQGEKRPEELDDALFSSYLDSAGIPDPELIIRPSGEQRLSNFLLWQCAYSEFYYTDTLWPDFDEAELDRAIAAYQQRDRRFGGVKK